jgi:phosphohistidine swiveling domain-containing protein
MTTATLVSWDYWLNDWPSEKVVLTRANAADGYPKALTPLSQDLVLTFEEQGVRRFYFRSLKALRPGQCTRPFMQAYYGLVYLNADQMGDLGDAMPGTTRFSVYQTILGLESDPARMVPTPTLSDRLAEARSAVRVGPRVLKLAGSCQQRITNQLAAIVAVRPDHPDTLTLAEAHDWLERLEALQEPAWETLMIGTAIAIAFFETAEKAISRAVGEQGSDLTNRLHVGLGGNESAEAGHAIRQLAVIARDNPATRVALETGASLEAVLASSDAFALQLREVVERFGHRAPAELELSNHSWREEPSQLLDIVRIELQRPAQEQTGQSVREDAEQQLKAAAHGLKGRLIQALLRRSRDLMAVRENGKTPIVKVFDETRRLLSVIAPALVAAGEIPAERDVFFLRYQELKAVLAGGTGPGIAEIARRREQHKRCLELELPELVEVDGRGLRTLDDAFIRERGLLPPSAVDEASDKLVGIAASPGSLTGTARVMLDPYGDFEPGDVLFAKTVDPGWAPILSCAGAIVLDMGGPMSHGAMVARELGIPCVVNVRSGMTLVRSGEQVAVDGSAGEVRLLRPVG